MEPAGQLGAEVASHRACMHCRSQKIRCIPEESNPDVCQRCARAGRACVFTPLQKRKPRKRTDTRVAELEREMRTMHAMLRQKESAASKSECPSNQKTSSNAKDNEKDVGAMQTNELELIQGSSLVEPYHGPRDAGKPGTTDEPERRQFWATQLRNWPKSAERDVIERGIISFATARQLVNSYRRSLFPHFPAVVIPEDIQVEDFRTQSPTLFLAVLAASAAKDDAQLSAILDREILHAYAERSMVRSEKSVELVQAMLLSAAWYHPPAKYGQLKYFEYIAQAVAMAMDLGIGTRPSMRRARFTQVPFHEGIHHLEDAANPDLSMSTRSQESRLDTASLENRRTLLVCFIVSSTVCTSLRRPHMLRTNSYIHNCVEFFEASQDALPSDRTLIRWVKLIVIAQEFSIAFCYDDPGSTISIADLPVQLMLKDYAKRLSDWYASVPPNEMYGSLAILYWSIRISLHEIVLHIDHSPEDFMAPYQMGAIRPWTGADLPTQLVANAVSECIDGAHQLLTAFTGTSPESARAMPVFCYVRLSFAGFILAKLCLSAAHPNSGVGKVLNAESIRAEAYMNKAILHVRSVIGATKARVPAIFLALLFKLRHWCLHPNIIDNSGAETSAITNSTSHATIIMHNSAEEGNDSSRVTEVSTSNDNTPQSQRHDGSEQPFDGSSSVTSIESITPASLAPRQTQQPGFSMDSMIPAEYAAMLNQPETVNMSVSGLGATPESWFNPGEQMQLDQEFYQFFNEMNANGGGGFNVLEDWPANAAMTDPMPGLNWQGDQLNTGMSSNAPR